MPVHEPAWLLLVIYLVAGCLLLAKGSDWLVGGSSRLARRLGVSTLVIGLTVVAWGTSAPEVVVSVLAALEGQAAISLGNVLGSNIANIGLVLGACALVLPKVLEGRLGFRDIFWLFGSVAALWWCALDGKLTRADSAFLLGLFAIYNVWVWKTARPPSEPQAAEAADGVKEESASGWRSPWVVALGGVVSISVGAKLVVMGAEGGALRLGVEPRVVGLTVVAVGTSLPELAAGIGSALKGESDISLGNVLGSNVFNVLAVLGLVAVVRPLIPEAPGVAGAAGAQDQLASAFEGALANDFPYVMAFSLAFLVLPLLGGARLGRWKGALLLGAYAWYTVQLF